MKDRDGGVDDLLNPVKKIGKSWSQTSDVLLQLRGINCSTDILISFIVYISRPVYLLSVFLLKGKLDGTHFLVAEVVPYEVSD